MASPVRATANTPIHTKGNWFWRGEERFLIKGISYIPRRPGGDSYGSESKIDPLDDTRIEELGRDVEVFRELGLNTIQVSALSPDRSYRKAMKVLAEADIYVIVTLYEHVKAPNDGPHNMTKVDPNMDVSPYHTAESLGSAIKIVDEMSTYPNLLAFTVATDAVSSPGVSKLAEVFRAAVRDIKSFLRKGGGRCPPVGVSVNHIVMMIKDMLEYFTAGDAQERADFFAMDCWSWVYKSSFEISGWKGMVDSYGKFPVPMYLSAFGGRAGKPRLWQEIGCLYSPDMTGVFSGGCLYTYLEYGNHYGIVKPSERGIARKPEFALLKKQLDNVNGRNRGELYFADCKNYENWMGQFPETRDQWRANSDVPDVPGRVEELVQELADEKEWEVVDPESLPGTGVNHGATSEPMSRLAERVGDMGIEES